MGWPEVAAPSAEAAVDLPRFLEGLAVLLALLGKTDFANLEVAPRLLGALWPRGRLPRLRRDAGFGLAGWASSSWAASAGCAGTINVPFPLLAPLPRCVPMLPLDFPLPWDLSARPGPSRCWPCLPTSPSTPFLGVVGAGAAFCTFCVGAALQRAWLALLMPLWPHAFTAAFCSASGAAFTAAFCSASGAVVFAITLSPALK